MKTWLADSLVLAMMLILLLAVSGCRGDEKEAAEPKDRSSDASNRLLLVEPTPTPTIAAATAQASATLAPARRPSL